ncbi:hypothetical protein ACLOJK_028710, partial [Asimina triloba]
LHQTSYKMRATLEEQATNKHLPYIHTIMKFSRPTVVAASAILVLLLLLSPSEAAVQCSDVVKALAPCTTYLKSGGTPTGACCSGLKQLNSLASLPADRKTACGCLKDAAQKMNPNEAAAKSLPGSCGITLPVAVSKNVDCSKYGQLKIKQLRALQKRSCRQFM